MEIFLKAMQTIIPLVFIVGMIYTIFNIELVAEYFYWLFSFKERKAYKTAMKCKPYVEKRGCYNNIVGIKFILKSSNLFCYVFLYTDKKIAIGIYDENDKCLYGDTIIAPAKAIKSPSSKHTYKLLKRLAVYDDELCDKVIQL